MSKADRRAKARSGHKPAPVTLGLGRPAPRPSRGVIVTAYHDEPRAALEQAIASVSAQTVRVEHVVVADGAPQDWVDGAGVRHLRLDRAHGDHGHTARGIGALLAISEGFDGIGFLDAEGRLAPDHVATCLATATAAGPDCDVVVARRVIEAGDGDDTAIDGNRLFFLPGAFHMLHRLAAMPREIAAVGDTLFLQALKAETLVIAEAKTATVHGPLRRAGTVAGAAELRDPAAVDRWIESRSPRERILLTRLLGIGKTA